MFLFIVLSLLVRLGLTSQADSNRDLQPRVDNSPSKPRTFILTDILNEPDDSQSLIRYLLYANDFDTRGLVATTSLWLQNETHPEAIISLLDTYAQVFDNLNKHVPADRQYEDAEQLKLRVASGYPVCRLPP